MKHPFRFLRLGILALLLGELACLPLALAGAQTAANTDTSGTSAVAETPQQVILRLFEEGRKAYESGDYTQAEKAWAEGREKAQGLQDALWESRFLNVLGIVYSDIGQHPKALECYARALEMREKLGNQQAIASTLNNMGIVHFRLGEYEKASSCYTRALEIAQKLNVPDAIASALNNLGAIYQTLGQYEKALDYYTRALELRQKLNNPKEIAQSLNNIGIVWSSLGEYEKAQKYYQDALELRRTQGNPEEIAASLNNLGRICSRRGAYEDALEYHSQALALVQKSENPQADAACQSSLGSVYHSLGQFERALDCYNLVLDIFQKTGSRPEISDNLNNIGVIYGDMDQYDKALEYHRRALEIRQQLGAPEDIAVSYNNIGIIHDSREQYTQSLEYHRRALEIREKLGNPKDLTASLSNIGALYNNTGQYDKALECHLRALAIREKLGNPKDIAQSCFCLGKVYYNLQQWEKSQAAFERAIQLYETASEQVIEPTGVGAFQEANQGGIYAHYSRLLLRRNPQNPMDALIMAERGRGRGLAQQVAQSHINLAQFQPDEADHWKKAQKEYIKADRLLTAAQQRLAQAVPKERQSAEKQRDEAKRRYAEAERQLTMLRGELYKRYPDFRRRNGAELPTSAQLKDLARRHPDTLYLHYDILEGNVTLLYALSHKDSLRAFTLPVGKKQLSQQTQTWRASLTAPAEMANPNTPLAQKGALRRKAAEEPTRARTLSTTLLKPLEQAGLLQPGRYRRLVFIPDGPLDDIPFAALMDGKGKRLIDRYALSTSLSLGLLLWPPHRKPSDAALFFATDPTGEQGERFAMAARSNRLMGGAPEPLRFAREGARQVAQMFPGALGLAGPMAREASVKAQMGRYALLLFATHGYLDATDGMRSWLLLAPEPDDSPEDGRLRAREILDVPLSAQLAVLMACESGLGQRRGLDGLHGLVWAFWAAGCPSVVASQWKVEEASTKPLMVEFHRGIRAGRPKDEALQAAIQAVRKTLSSDHPFYWAAFQVFGDVAPVRLKNDSTSASR